MDLARIGYYLRASGLQGLFSVLRSKALGTPCVLQVRRAETRHPIYLRFPSADIGVYDQVFEKGEFELEVIRTPRAMVDAGANIGLVSVYWAIRFPEARILAIEPEANNFDMLQRNTAPYTNITPIRAALWDKNTQLIVIDSGSGEWAFVTRERCSPGEYGHGAAVRGMTVDQLMQEYGLETIDVLKIDIEGSEKEVFQDPSLWIGRVDTLIVELHDRMRAGCSRSFYNATDGFACEWVSGEHVWLTREVGCLRREPHSTHRMLPGGGQAQCLTGDEDWG